MDHTAKWMKPRSEGIPPVPESKATAWLGLSPQAAALAVLILLGLVISGAYLNGFSEHFRRASAAAKVGMAGEISVASTVPPGPTRAAVCSV